MPQLILHHYPTSPFAEKVRLIFGIKGLPWSSVMIPTIMPKPDLTALTGGYRKTPVLQIGADIYCDTALIADVIEELPDEDQKDLLSHLDEERAADIGGRETDHDPAGYSTPLSWTGQSLAPNLAGFDVTCNLSPWKPRVAQRLI